MTMYRVDGTDLTNIANAIRAKIGSANLITISNMPIEINNIPTGSSTEYLFLPADLIANYYIERNGTQTAYNGWSCTDFIEVTPGEILKIACADDKDYNCWYNVSQQCLTNFRLNKTGYSELTVPANAYYIRISNTTDNMQNYIRLWR